MLRAERKGLRCQAALRRGQTRRRPRERNSRLLSPTPAPTQLRCQRPAHRQSTTKARPQHHWSFRRPESARLYAVPMITGMRIKATGSRDDREELIQLGKVLDDALPKLACEVTGHFLAEQLLRIRNRAGDTVPL